MKFSPNTLLPQLQALPDCKALVVALSGGLDSSVLLQALHELREESLLQPALKAIHVNHGLQRDAPAWQEHCENLCQQLGIPLRCAVVKVELGNDGSGLEVAARKARYQAFEELLQCADVLLQGHHLDDQMETLMLRVMRGAGARGLASIPQKRQLGKTYLLRPLLGIERQELLDYATAKGLSWMEDESNKDISYDRNFCRHQLLPLIATRWPGYRESWSKTIQLAAEAEQLQQALAAEDFIRLQTEHAGRVRIGALLALSDVRRRNVLRYWLQSLGLPELGWNRMQQLSSEMIMASNASSAVINAESYQLRRHADTLHVLRKLELPATEPIQWDAAAFDQITLPKNGSLCASQLVGKGLKLDASQTLEIRYRQGGESCRLKARPNKSLKKILQESQLLPWVRERLPLIFVGDDLACIPGIGIAEQYTVAADKTGFVVEWQQPVLEFN